MCCEKKQSYYESCYVDEQVEGYNSCHYFSLQMQMKQNAATLSDYYSDLINAYLEM